MATITRGSEDPTMQSVKRVLGEYEAAYPGAVATLYRQNNVSIRIRIVDNRFAKLSTPDRHDQVWNFLAERLDDEILQDISILLLLAPAEQASSFLNSEFDEPIPSHI